MNRAAHGRVAPEGVNEKMLTIRSHQHQPRHGGDGRSLLEKVIWKWNSANGFCRKAKISKAARGLQKEGR